MTDSREEGDYEVHLTVHFSDSAADELATFARLHGYKFLHVLLDAGISPSQPMLSWRQRDGVKEALRRSAFITDALKRRGLEVARLKVEGRPELNVGARYLEAHFKVELDDGRLRELTSLASELGVHLSRTARSRSAGTEQRFLTARGRTMPATERFFDGAEAALRRRGWRLLSKEREAVLYDSNLDLDQGWST